MKNESPQLKDGSEWIDHEDCLVGNKAGLKNLIKACEIALEKGEFYGNDLGDYVGIKKLENDWFKDPKDSPKTRYENLILGAVLIVVVLLILTGLATFIKWLF